MNVRKITSYVRIPKITVSHSHTMAKLLSLQLIIGKTHEIGKVAFELFDIKEHVELQTAEDEEDGQDRYEINVRFEMRVIDKHVDFYAYWPAEGQPQVTVTGVHQHVNLISAFKPGTA